MISFPTSAVAQVLASLVREYDVADLLAELLDELQTALGASAAGILIRAEGGELEALTTTSHRATELEIYQAQLHSGPCVDAIVGAEPVHATSAAAITERWPTAGAEIVASGYTGVHAFPVRWHDVALGALSVLYGVDRETPYRDGRHREFELAGQAFADIVALVLVQDQEIDPRELLDRTEQALAGRTIIEQAKGVIAYRQAVPIDEAYDNLRALAATDGNRLTAAARAVVDAAVPRPQSRT